MSSVAAQTYLTPKEYLITERKATLKSEYLSGEIVAMSGASHEHNLITVNTVNGLYNQLADQGCRVYASDMCVGISAGDSYFYSDVTVVCEKPRFEDNEFDTLINPIVVIEVLLSQLRCMTKARNLGVISNWSHYKNTYLFHRIILELNAITVRAKIGYPAN